MAWRRKAKNEFDQNTYKDVMVDIETMSTETNAQVVSIGAVRFRLDTQDDINSIHDTDRTFYARLNLKEQEEEMGRDSDPDTLAWWSKQSKAARAVFDEKEEDVGPALLRFVEFCKGAKRIWGNGNMFDNAIIRDLCDDAGVEYPFYYSQDLDVRTLTYLWNSVTNWLSKGKRPEVNLGAEHDALDDAKRQVIQCQIMYNQIRGSKYGPETFE